MELPGEKLVIKLWETLAEKGIGSLLSPWQAGREGRARNLLRREEILMLAQAEKDAADIRSGRKQLHPNGSLMLANEVNKIEDARIEPTFAFTTAVDCGNRAAAAAAARSEINASKAILFAEEQLANDQQQPPERQLDEDWLFVWREHAGKVSTDDLQRMWGSVLAGEVKAPGRYSIRTMEFLKTLSKTEAESITKVASYVIDGRIARAQKDFLTSKGVSFSMLLHLQELGVVSGVEAIGLSTKYRTLVDGKFLRGLVSHNKVLVVEHDDPTQTLEFEVYLLTDVGRQVLGLGSFEPDVEYLQLVGKDFAKKGFTVKLADWRDVSEAEGEYFNAQAISGDELPAEAQQLRQ